MKDRPLTAIADYAINDHGLTAVQEYIRNLLLPFQPADFHKLLPKFFWHAVVTTNYDLIVEQSYSSTSNSNQSLIPYLKNGQRVETELKKQLNGLQFLKLHGCINHHLDASIPLILSSEQYAKYGQNRTLLYDRLKSWGQEFPIIFCGYSINDPHIQTILFDIFDNNINRPMFYVVLPQIPEIEARYWSAHRITPIQSTYKSFLEALNTSIPSHTRLISPDTGGGTSPIRSHYRIANPTESAALLSFLDKDVDYVTREMPYTLQPPKEFYHGYDLGWGSIIQKLDVYRRMIDSVIVDAILSDEAERPSLVDLYVLKGPAGNGKTVALKRIAWESATEFSKLVFFLRENGAIREDAIFEISRLTGKRIFLFVDRIALAVNEVKSLIQSSINNKIPITVVAAERESEWNTRCSDLEPYLSMEFPVRYLAESEIRILLEKLEEHDALGTFEEYSFDQRLEYFLNRADRQLLVALHEATSGRPFEEIVFEEYNRISPPEAQHLYLDVCTLNKLGVGVRAGLISRVSGIRFEDFQRQFFRPLEYIVRTYYDNYAQDYMYVARHRHVADILFDQVLPDGESKFNQTIRLLSGLNTDYSSDDTGFRQIIRGRSVADTFRSQELGRQIYDRAQQRFGENAYVFQQRAIFEMIHPGGDLSLAEDNLEIATQLAPTDKAIQHSRAQLARRQAQQTTNPLLRTKLRQRAYENLTGLIGEGRHDSHPYYTRVRLALDQLNDLLEGSSELVEDLKSERELIEAVKFVEEGLADALQRFPENENLVTVESEFRDAIQQHERAETALRRAFKINPRQDWIAVRLSKKILAQSDVDGAKKILLECLQSNPASKRAHFELARLYMRFGEDKDRKYVLEHLRKSFTEGDPNINAQFWYARELFAQQKFDESEKIFTVLKQSRLPVTMRNNIRGVLRGEDGKPIQFGGSVVRKESSYLFVRCDGFQRDVFVHVSNVPNSDWEKINNGSRVSVEIGFTYRGPAANYLRIEVHT